jgi:hypothetical protein
MQTRKKQTAIRFSQDAAKLVEGLKQVTGLTATGVIESAIREMAQRRGVVLTPPPPTEETEAQRKARQDAAFARFLALSQKQNFSSGNSSLRFLREARAGAMFGYEPTEEEIAG